MLCQTTVDWAKLADCFTQLVQHITMRTGWVHGFVMILMIKFL